MPTINRAIELEPEDAKAYYSRGNAYEEKGDYDQAIADYDKTIELDPEHVTAYNNRGATYHYNKGEVDRAIQDYDKAINLEPSCSALVYINRGYAYDNKNNTDRAIEDYDNAVRLCSYETELNRKFAYWSIDEVDKRGRSEVDKVIERLNGVINKNSPETADHYYYTGVRQLFMNDGLSAERCFKIALKLGYDDREKIERHLENLKKRG